MSLDIAFPKLAHSAYKISSPDTKEYNCIAWAASDNSKWWWPDLMEQYYWPAAVPREESMDTFVAAFASLGFEKCGHGTLEPACEKIALFEKNGLPTHAARQILSGLWTSKLGVDVDIEHELESLEGYIYGRVACFMQRKTSSTARTT
jgi:hypothetical protein